MDSFGSKDLSAQRTFAADRTHEFQRTLVA